MPNSVLSEWFASPLGAYVLTWEQQQCDAWVADIFGYNALQIGLPDCDYLRQSRIVSRFHSCGEFVAAGAQALPLSNSPAASAAPGLVSQPFALPFASASLDLVVLPHVLEFSTRPHQVLREVERVLVPDGVVLVAGFNPYSLWGARRVLKRRSAEAPWCGHFFSARRMRDWLTLLSLECDDTEYGCYSPPLTHQSATARWRSLERAGARAWPMCGGVYLLRAVKRVQGMHVILPAWRDTKRVKARLAPVANGSRTMRER